MCAGDHDGGAGRALRLRRTDRPDISTGRESQVNVQHAVAAALVTGNAGLDQFTDACVRDSAFATIAIGRDCHRRRRDACRSRRRAAATSVR
jgi:hypothetical protein